MDKRTPKNPIHFQLDLNSEQKDAKNTILQNKITVLTGMAGSGKTLVAVQAALEMLFRKEIDKIVLSRSIVTAGEDVGIMPGNIDSKLEPYVAPLLDALYSLYNKDKIDSLIHEDKIKVIPVGLMRGRNLSDCVAVIDECLIGSTLIAIDWSDNVLGRNTKTTSLKRIVDDFKKDKAVKVLSYNSINNIIEKKKVTNVFEKGLQEVITINFGHKIKELIATSNHPLAVLENGKLFYKNVSELKTDDYLLRIVKPNSNNSRILKEDNYDILLGLLLGDGCLLKSKQSDIAYRLTKTHSLAQENYNNYCRDIFNGVNRINLKSGYTGKPLCGMSTKNIILSQEFVDSLYKDSKKSISENIEKFFTERTLAFWYMDDGSLSSNKDCVLHTCGFSKIENEILKDILKRKFNLDVNIGFTKNKYYYLRFNRENSQKLINIIKNYMHDDVLYKINIDREFIEVLPKFIEGFSCSKINSIKPKGKEIVYNIEVEDNNNYIAENILSHNCQNITGKQMKLILTRLCKGSKMILCGDTDQIDLKDDKQSGFAFICEKLKDIEGFKVVTLKTNHRDEIVEKVLAAYTKG